MLWRPCGSIMHWRPMHNAYCNIVWILVPTMWIETVKREREREASCAFDWQKLIKHSAINNQRLADSWTTPTDFEWLSCSFSYSYFLRSGPSLSQGPGRAINYSMQSVHHSWLILRPTTVWLPSASFPLFLSFSLLFVHLFVSSFPFPLYLSSSISFKTPSRLFLFCLSSAWLLGKDKACTHTHKHERRCILLFNIPLVVLFLIFSPRPLLPPLRWLWRSRLGPSCCRSLSIRMEIQGVGACLRRERPQTQICVSIGEEYWYMQWTFTVVAWLGSLSLARCCCCVGGERVISGSLLQESKVGCRGDERQPQNEHHQSNLASIFLLCSCLNIPCLTRGKNGHSFFSDLRLVQYVEEPSERNGVSMMNVDEEKTLFVCVWGWRDIPRVAACCSICVVGLQTHVIITTNRQQT